MESTKDIVVGQLVKSKSGRDMMRLFLVYGVVDDAHVLLVDGKLRKLEKPKLKKIKHLIVYHTIVEDFQKKVEENSRLTNSQIRKYLEPFLEEEH
ncbi:KOW domain-containing RNA-binding protein [Fenollaria sporofastidiosus]|uniref:KOW domain-containing RNA-binding protein n=1 Tax=Fenollaria sporofastidiosus TaxID=2811778 RepID=UPI001BFFD9B7|nr:KOW domain-containing RNA-binding protein [Fenollaria sporofastidiosus]